MAALQVARSSLLAQASPSSFHPLQGGCALRLSLPHQPRRLRQRPASRTVMALPCDLSALALDTSMLAYVSTELPQSIHSALSLDTSMLAFVSAELPEGINYTIETSDFHLSQEAIKAFYMVFSCVFCWGAVVFGSMNDAYYESDEYRNAGGNGTQFWMYEKVEEDEEAAREELWRDELRQEIEEKVGEIKELAAGEEEKAKEVV